MTFQIGNPGRPKGAINRKRKEIRDLAHRFITDGRYLRGLLERLRNGEAPHMEVLLHHYAYGKPKERIEVEHYDVTALEVHLVEARQNGANGNGHRGTSSPVLIDVTPEKDDDKS